MHHSLAHRSFRLIPVLFVLLAGTADAQPEAAPLVVMNLAAHPDDEDGSTLAYFRHGRDAIAYSVIFTRGEGGQNEIGPELYEELGVIRTAETERAARRLGTQVYFLNFMDFGFSKSAEETFERWGGRDEVTSRLVYLIRKLKPDVLFTNHDTVTVGPGRQHGHHQVVGLTAWDAFELAADPKYHPEQLDEPGIDVWQPKRLFRRMWTTDGSHDVAVPVGDRVRQSRNAGLTFAGIAAEALHEHASQGMDLFADRVAGWDSTYFEIYRTASDAAIPHDDLAGGLPANVQAEPDLTYWIDSGRLPALDAFTLSDSVLVPGQSVELRWVRSQLPDRPFRLKLFGAVDTTIVIRDDMPDRASLSVNRDAVPTIPKVAYQYEHMLNHAPIGYAVYELPSGDLEAGGYLAAEIAPPIFVEATEDVVRLRPGPNLLGYTMRVFDEEIDEITLATALAGDAAERIFDQYQESRPITGGITRGEVTLNMPGDAEEGSYTISLAAFARGGINGPSMDDDFVAGRLFSVDVPEGLRVGVVRSYDNTLEQALSQMNVEAVVLDSLDLARGNFDDLHTIVVDIRAYLVRPDLRAHNDRLLRWV